MTVNIQPGAPTPMGSVWDGGGVNFALFSAHAERVELCLFSEAGDETRVTLPARSGDVWHGRIAGLGPGARYGYRVHGPYDPEQGHRFNPNKLLIDPHARRLDGTVRWSDAVFGYRIGDPAVDLSFDTQDSAPWVPRCVVTAPPRGPVGSARPRTPWQDTVIYECHVRGMTQRHPGVDASVRGTFAGLASAPVIAHLRELGVSAVELMPVQAFLDDQFLVEKGLRNYWGYNTLSFFAPEVRYLDGDGLDGFRRMVNAFHEADIEVLLDVVYNHTAEGNELGPTLCYRGIDNASYYRLREAAPRGQVDYTGCGNSLALHRAPVREMVLSSLRYWVEEMGVDGFRFDLAVTLGRGADGFEPGGAFLAALAADPVLKSAKLIAEPWDVGPEGYRLGGFPPGWAEWNDRFRDSARRFWRRDPGELPEFARRMHGSSDLFDHAGRGPWASVNYVASHDGFTLADVTAYVDRHNQANGEDNRDGHGANFSANLGHEGPADDPAILAARARRQRNLVASALLAQGTPMLLAGDEFGRSQGGNNNAYCQDNETTWIDWTLTQAARDLAAFTRRLVALRRRYLLLRRPHYAHGRHRDPLTGLADVTWLTRHGTEMEAADWQAADGRFLAMALAATAPDDAQAPAPNANAEGAPLLVVMYAGDQALEFELPSLPGLRGWQCELSSAGPLPSGVLSRLTVEPDASYLLVAVV